MEALVVEGVGISKILSSEEYSDYKDSLISILVDEQPVGKLDEIKDACDKKYFDKNPDSLTWIEKFSGELNYTACANFLTSTASRKNEFLLGSPLKSVFRDREDYARQMSSVEDILTEYGVLPAVEN